MKIALLGAMGFVGRVAAGELAARPEVRELLLVDYNVREAKKYARSLSSKCRWAMADVGRAPDLERLLDDVDAVANAVGPCSEYERTVLLTCAGAKTPAASVGDGSLSPAEQGEIHDAFRRAGVPAVSGCGMQPGWTELLEAHLLRKGNGAGEIGPAGGKMRFFFCSPDRFGGYAFFRRISRGTGGRAPSPSCAPPGRYFHSGEGKVFGLPEGRPARVYTGIGRGLGGFGTVGKELAAAFLFWTRGTMKAVPGMPAAAAGVFVPGRTPDRFAAVSDPAGKLSGALLARAVIRLAQERGKEKGLLELPGIIGREEAGDIAAACGGDIRAG